MIIEEFVWLSEIIDKVEVKHRVQPEEAEEIFFNRPRFRFVENGDRKGDMFIQQPAKPMRGAI